MAETKLKMDLHDGAGITFFSAIMLVAYMLCRVICDGHWLSAGPLLNVLLAAHLTANYGEPIKTNDELEERASRLRWALWNNFVALFVLCVCEA